MPDGIDRYFMAQVRELLAQVGCMFGAGRENSAGPAPQNAILWLLVAQVGYLITDLRHARAFCARKAP